MLRDFFGAFKRVADVRDFLSSTGGVRTDLPVGVFGVLKLEGADCFLARGAADRCVRPSTESARRGRFSADFKLLAEAGLIGVEVLLPSGCGELLPLLALLDARVLLPLFNSTGKVFPLREEALLSIGETVPGSEDSLVSDVLLLAGETLPRGAGGAGAGAGGAGSTGSTLPRRPCVTRRTWQGSCRDRKCSSVSQPPPTRTIM